MLGKILVSVLPQILLVHSDDLLWGLVWGFASGLWSCSLPDQTVQLLPYYMMMKKAAALGSIMEKNIFSVPEFWHYK